jgi:hypothetical protein
MQKLIPMVICAILAFLATDASAEIITYSWSGFCEDPRPTNSWGLAGDGSFSTNDGSVFTVSVSVSTSTPDVSLRNNEAIFQIPNSFGFVIDGVPLDVGYGQVIFTDDSGISDVINFTGFATRNGVTEQVYAQAYLPNNTFDLFDTASADAPPLFSASYNTDWFALTGINSITIIALEDTPVTVTTAVPEPSSIATMLMAAVGYPTWKRFKKSLSST